MEHLYCLYRSLGLCSIAKRLEYQTDNQMVQGSMLSYCYYFLEQETTRIAPVYQAIYWGPGGLIPTGEAIHISQWTKAQVGLQVHTPSPVRHSTASCRLVVLPQEDLTLST